ncbi:hypothetical protein B0H11DRAFT_2399875 [Mycena galericulata]|nr:hypothetical protein B0H11DRAFT_2399875 [Mycena galericulata]
MICLPLGLMVVGNAVPISNSDIGLRCGQRRFRPVHSLDGEVYMSKCDCMRCLYPMTEVEILFVPSMPLNQYIIKPFAVIPTAMPYHTYKTSASVAKLPPPPGPHHANGGIMESRLNVISQLVLHRGHRIATQKDVTRSVDDGFDICGIGSRELESEPQIESTPIMPSRGPALLPGTTGAGDVGW